MRTSFIVFLFSIFVWLGSIFINELAGNNISYNGFNDFIMICILTVLAVIAEEIARFGIIMDENLKYFKENEIKVNLGRIIMKNINDKQIEQIERGNMDE